MSRLIKTKRGHYRIVGDEICSVAISTIDSDDYFVFDTPISKVTDREVQERIDATHDYDAQEALISDIHALVEEYILSDETYQDIERELNWIGIGEDKDDYRLNIEIRKNP